MITIHNDIMNGLKGIIYHKEDVIGVCGSAESLLDIQCQIKAEKCADYKMEVEVEIAKGSKRTYVYRFAEDGRMIPSSYPGVTLWIDELNKKLLYLYNFSVSNDFKI